MALKALDLFCGAGGASCGLERAGFEVVGVDHVDQPAYPYRFVQMNAMDAPLGWLSGFDLVWASPPCQAFTAYQRRKRHVRPAPNLIPRVRALLQRAGVPYIIENVPGAPLQDSVQLCGSSFGLDVRRHRIFETTFPVLAPECAHQWQTPRFPPASNRRNRRCTVEVGVWRIPLEVQQRAMGIDWMTREELSQAVPPAYSEHLAREFRRHRKAA